MKKLNTSPISGMQELLPAQQAVFNQLKSKIAEVYHHHGFQSIETPTIDRAEILLAKAGGDTEKQIYKVFKTAETADDADQALRFDHTVPLARYVVEHESDLCFPFKVTQIGRNFRGERAQKGRFREFYQCDVDVIGRGTLPLAYDADTIATLISALKAMGLPKTMARISNRKIWSGFFEAVNLQEHAQEILGVIDHAEKVAPEDTIKALQEIGLSESNVVKITTLMGIHGSGEEIRAKFDEVGVDNEKFREGVNELMTVLSLLSAQGLDGDFCADLLIVRGLDYYTGTVFECILPEHREVGSVCGGGRYENLASYFTEQALPGVGGSIGLTRLFAALSAAGLIDEVEAAPVETMILPLSQNEYAYALSLAEKLRAEGGVVDVDFSDKKLGARFERAAKIAKRAIVIGEDEVKSGQYTVKDLSA